MDQRNASVKNCMSIQGSTVRACELRLVRRTVTVDGTEQVEFLCGAGGGPEQGHVLGVAGGNLSSMVAICNACPIPDALEAHQSCLNLVPVRRFPGGKRSLPMVQSLASQAVPSRSSEPVESFFPCRIFYTLYRQNQPRDTIVCRSCTHWFPRPPFELIPDYWTETQKMLRVVNGEESTLGPPTGFAPASPQPSGTWWRRLLQRVHL